MSNMITITFIYEGSDLIVSAENKGNQRKERIKNEFNVETIIGQLMDKQVVSLLDLFDIVKMALIRKELGVDPIGKAMKLQIGEKKFTFKNRITLADVLIGTPVTDALAMFKRVYMEHAERAIDKVTKEHFGV